jgi:hypothetical protein
MIIPISTNTTMAPCSQIHVGDMSQESLAVELADRLLARRCQTKQTIV